MQVYMDLSHGCTTVNLRVPNRPGESTGTQQGDNRGHQVRVRGDITQGSRAQGEGLPTGQHSNPSFSEKTGCLQRAAPLEGLSPILVGQPWHDRRGTSPEETWKSKKPAGRRYAHMGGRAAQQLAQGRGTEQCQQPRGSSRAGQAKGAEHGHRELLGGWHAEAGQ